LLFWVNLDRIFALALAAVIVSAGLLAMQLLGRRIAAALVAILALLGLGLLPAWDVERLASGLFRQRQVLPSMYAGPDAFFKAHRSHSRVTFYTDDPASTVSVLETQSPEGRLTNVAIMTNGKADGSIAGDYTTMALTALLPAIFSAQPERAFVIGYGTGVSAGEFAALEATRKVTVAEISPGVIEAAPHFESHNRGALSNPKTEVILSDAFRALLRSEDKWDVIISEPSNPWVTGIEMLYSVEFLTAARDRLRPGGVYAQWFHVYEADDEVVSLVLRTYDAVFEHVALWYAAGTDMILLGFEEGSRPLDLELAQRRAAQPDIAAGLRRAGIDGFPALLAHEVLPLDVLRAAHLEGDLHTLLHPVLSHRAARAFFAGRMGALPLALTPPAESVGRENSLLVRYRRSQGGRLSEAEHRSLVGEACKVRPTACATLVASWELDVPESEAREQLLRRLRATELFRGVLTRESLSTLKLLLGGPVPESRGRLSLAEIRRRSQLYLNHYHHGAPFDRSVLADSWRHCNDESFGTQCGASRIAIEREIGPLVPPTARGEDR
jgi:spermidine synthase